MNKKEYVYHNIMSGCINAKKTNFTQRGLALDCNISLGYINKVIKELEEIGVLEIKSRYFQLIDAKKLLTFWATKRNLNQEIIYKTHCDLSIKQIESQIPNDVAFTAYSAYRLTFKDAPADYDKVYVYGTDARTFEKRFPYSKGNANIVLLKRPEFLNENIAPLDLIYVDLWNLKEWFASEFIKSLERKIFND